VTNSVSERIARLVEPLQSDIAALDVEILAVESRLEGLKADRRQLRAVLKATEPKSANGGKPGPKPKPAQVIPPSDDALETVRAFIRAKPADERGQIVAGTLANEMQAAATDDNYPRKDTVRRAVHTLHANGELRLKRTRTVGGGLVYSYLGG
jgi:hypothetical protein